jgi:hypothetical protein
MVWLNEPIWALLLSIKDSKSVANMKRDGKWSYSERPVIKD